MLKHKVLVGLCRAWTRTLTVLVVAVATYSSLGASGCSGGAGADGAGGTTTQTAVIAPSTSASGSSASSTKAVQTSSINAIQVITKADGSGSFDPVSVPLSGGSAVKASRLFNLDGSMITAGNVPTWFIEARVFLTSTRTSAGAAAGVGADTPCAYFDNVSGDINPDTSGFYTIDGYNTDTNVADVDQCTGTAAGEQSQIGAYVRLDRRFMNATDKIQIIIKAKPIDAPNTTITPSSCVTGGFFDPTACANQMYTVTMRTTPNAPSKPFYILFPTAKAFDLLSESVLLPISIDQSISTISIDRAKGGAIIYGITVIRLY